MGKIVVALGGSVFGNNVEEQKEAVSKAVVPITDMIEQGHHVILSHGSLPQLSSIKLAFDGTKDFRMPFPECEAMSQGYIGYHLQNALRHELGKRGIAKSIATLVTQVVVDSKDSAFRNPAKPIGAFYTKEEADNLSKATGDTYIEDSGRGYRKAVASPKPLEIVEKAAMKELMDAGHIIIGAGGGGVPVIRKGKNRLVGVEALIDKDSASRLLAHELDADFLFILTTVDQVALNYGTPNERPLDRLSVEEARQYMAEGHFPPETMLPKVQAAIEFVAAKKERKAIISSLERARDAVNGKTGTVIYSEKTKAVKKVF